METGHQPMPSLGCISIYNRTEFLLISNTLLGVQTTTGTHAVVLLKDTFCNQTLKQKCRLVFSKGQVLLLRECFENTFLYFWMCELPKRNVRVGTYLMKCLLRECTIMINVIGIQFFFPEGTKQIKYYASILICYFLLDILLLNYLFL